MSAHVALHRDGAVLCVTLARPEKKNALTADMYRALIAALQQAQDDPDVGAVLLRGSGGSFTAGNDIGDFLAQAGKPGAFAALDFVRAIATCDVPLVAAVDGAAVGIGTTLLFHCDLAYATPAATFRMPFVDLGLVPEAAASLLVPSRVGRVRATEMLLLCEPFDAPAAYAFGIVNAVVATQDLQATALARAQALAAKPREAVRLTRRLLRGDHSGVMARIEEEARLFAARLTSQEAQASMVAFMSRPKG